MLWQARSWLSSPLGINILLSLLRPERSHDKYLKLSDNGFKRFDIQKYISSKTDYILMNVAKLQMPWQRTECWSPVMTIYNTFSYTDDIKYDARLLDLPLQNKKFKLVGFVPNDMHIACCLFKKLSEEGLKSAVQSIHPLFTTVSELKAPNIEFQAVKETILEFTGRSGDVSSVALSIASVKINEEGVDINNLTCIHSGETCASKSNHNQNVASALNPFLFAIVFEDTAIFTGQYVCNN